MKVYGGAAPSHALDPMMGKSDGQREQTHHAHAYEGSTSHYIVQLGQRVGPWD